MRCLALFATTLLALSSVDPARCEVAAPETTEVFVGIGSSIPASLALAHRFLLTGSEAVTRSGRTLTSEIDYRLDPDVGILLVAEPLVEGERLEITYSWIPIDLPRDFVGLVQEEPTPADSTTMAEATALAGATTTRIARSVDENLVIGGAKTVAIAVGSNKDAAVEQSLRVSVTGRVGRDVKLTALLSDQNIPIQPEGTTQRLENLDEVLIRVDGPRGSAALGDIVAKRQGTAFGDWERRLSGAEASANAGRGQLRGIGASNRGSFRSVEFRGEEGRQGPYTIAGVGLNPTGVIVGGSERVWLDGRELMRGETQDYVIDYSRGELEFTNRRVITKDSEIAVDFEVAEQAYRRNLYFGEGGWNSGGDALSWRLGIASEIDDNEPLDLSLSDQQRDALAVAGDGKVLVSSAVCDSMGTGDYDMVSDLAGDYFVYAGADSGTCDVSFSFVGSDSGAYVPDFDVDRNRTFFRHVGQGNGDFAEGVLLQAPRSNTLADVGVRAAVGGFRLEADGALSQEDRNTLSSVGESDNQGRAAQVTLRFEDPHLSAFGSDLRLLASSSFRGEEATFAPLGRIRSAYLGEVWNFADTTRADESVGEISAQLENPGQWTLGGSWGRMERTGLFDSERSEGHMTWSGKRVPRANLRVESVQRTDAADSAGTVTGDLLRARGGLALSAAFLRPGVTFWKEGREDVRSGERIGGEDDVEVAGTLGIEPSRAFRGDLRYARRTTDVVTNGDWVRQSVGTTYEVRAEANPKRTLRARFSWIRRDLDFEEGRPESDQSTVLTRTDLQHENLEGLVRGEYVYKTTTRAVSDLLEGPGATAVPSLLLNASARILLGSNRTRRSGEGASSFLRRTLGQIRSETLARVEEETTNPDRTPIYLLDFSRFQDDAFTVFGRILLRQEITLFPSASAFSLTGRWERIDTEDNRAQLTRNDQLTERFVLRSTNRVGRRWTLQTQYTRQQDRRSDSGLGVIEFDNRLGELRGELAWQPGPATRVSGRAAVVDERNDVNDATIRGLALGLTASSTVFRNGRLRADASWTRPLSSSGIDSGRFRTRDVDEIDLVGSLELRLSKSINTSISYTGRYLEGSPTTHFARAEARALF